MPISRLAARGTFVAITIGWLAAHAPVGLAQDWPSKPVRVVAAHAAGGGPERSMRAMTAAMQNHLGQPVVIDYKPGANGNLAAAEVARAGADGYSVVLAQETIVTLNPLMYPNLGYTNGDIVPLGLYGSYSQMLVCNPSAGVKTLQDFVAKARTDKMSYATGGQGSPTHLTMEMLMQAAKIELTQISYKGPGPAVTDLLGGFVPCGFMPVPAVAEHVKSGRLVAIATSSQRRSELLPQVPTVAELGYRGFNATFYVGFFGNRRMPAEAQRKLSAAIAHAVRTPEVQQVLREGDLTPEMNTPDEAQKQLAALAHQWGTVAKRVNLKIE
jgi:tripartite-type tricarboxylate transporter receptor subunit TctC